MSAPIMVLRLLASQREEYLSKQDPVEWLFFQDGAPMGVPRATTLDQISQMLQQFSIPDHCRIVLVLPAEEVVLTRVSVPVNQKRKRDQLVPFILEEHLNQNVTDVFFATEWLTKSNDVGVAYCAKNRLEYWLGILDEQNVKPDVIYPEQYLLPCQDEHIFAIFDRDRVLVRQDHWVASVAPSAFAKDWIERAVLQMQAHQTPETGLKTIKVRLLTQRTDEALALSKSCADHLNSLAGRWLEERKAKDSTDNQSDLVDSNAEQDDPLSRIPSISREPAPWVVKVMGVVQVTTHVLAAEAARLVTEHHRFQLLQGAYKASRRRRKSKYNWQLAAGLFAAFLVFKFMHTSAEFYAYESAYLEARKENVSLFKEAFPHVNRIRGSLKRALSSEKAKTNDLTGAASFLTLMMSTGDTLRQAKGLDVKRLAFDANQSVLKIDLQVADYPALEQIQQQIEGKSLQVKIDGANKDENGVTARLRISVG